MNKILTHAVALLVGAGAGYFIAKLVLEKQYYSLDDSESDMTEKSDEQSEKTETSETPTISSIVDKPDSKSKINYNEMQKEMMKAELGIPDESTVVAHNVFKNPTTYEDPYRISEAEFDAEMADYDLEYLDYYPEEDILCNGDEEELNIADTIGLSCFSELEINTPTMWVLNPKIGCIYEIDINWNGYKNPLPEFIENVMSPREAREKERKENDE